MKIPAMQYTWDRDGLTARFLVAVSTSIVLGLSACGSPGAQDHANERNLPPYLTTPVAAARQAGLTVYWLGPQFEVEGRTFLATGGRFEHDEGPSFAKVYYGADSEGGGGIEFTLTSYAAEAWESARSAETPSTEGVIRQAVVVRGWPADLFAIPVGQWTNRLVIIQAPEGVVVAPATTTISNAGRQVNPLNNPDVLLAVLEDLRPYPE